MKKFKLKIRNSIIVVTMLLTLLGSWDVKAHSSKNIIEIPEGVIQYIRKATSVISVANQTVYTLQNLDTLGLAGIIQLGGMYSELDGVFDGALSDILSDSGMSGMFGSIKDGLFELKDTVESTMQEIFPSFDLEGLASSLMDGDYFSSVTSVLGDSFGLDMIIDPEIASMIAGDYLSGIVNAALTGGDLSAALEGALSNLAADALDYAIEQGTLIATDVADAVASEMKLDELTTNLEGALNSYTDLGIDIGSLMPSADDLIGAVMNGGDFSGILSGIQSEAMSQLQNAGEALAEQAMSDITTAVGDHLEEAMAGSDIFGGMSDLISQGAELYESMNAAYSQIQSELMEISGLTNDILGDMNSVLGTGLDLNGIPLASNPDLLGALSSAVGTDIGLPSALNVEGLITSSLDIPYQTQLLKMTGYIDDGYISEFGSKIASKIGFTDMDSDPVLYATPLVAPSVSSAVSSGSIGQIYNAQAGYLRDITGMTEEDKIFAIKSGAVSAWADSYGRNSKIAGIIDLSLTSLNEDGLYTVDVINKGVQEQKTVNGAYAASTSLLFETRKINDISTMVDAAEMVRSAVKHMYVYEN